MTEQTDKTAAGTALDWLWVAAALALVVGGLVAYYTLTAQPTAVRAVAVIAGLALGVGAFAMSVPGRQAWQFALGSRVELRKMVWPENKDAWRMTLVVMAFVAIAGVFFWVVDWVLAWATRHLLGTGG